MQQTMWKLENVIKNYDWGTTTELAQLFNISNPNGTPQAEIWMGAHPSGSSTAITSDGKKIPLNKLIAENPQHILGEQTYPHYQTLPYLFKVLSAQEPLSIQVHPELSKAKLGYEKENQLGIKLDSPQRNYKDPNHKPELIYALTPFLAMNGFRPITEIVSLFKPLNLQTINEQVQALISDQSDNGLSQFFHSLLTLNDDVKQKAIAELLAKIEHNNEVPFTIIKNMSIKYPNDSGLFSPLILNVIQLQPKQAMFLKAQTPHAYLAGTGLEIMASSDNVLRAGLTTKYIDIDELFANTSFQTISLTQLLTKPIEKNNKIEFPVPVNDFAFEVIHSDEQVRTENTVSAEIIFCISGQVIISTATDSLTLKAGESAFIACCANSYSYQGNATLARAFNH